MPTLSSLFNEWNALVPQAQARGIRVRPIRSLHESIAAGSRRVAWLREQLGSTAVRSPRTFGVEIELIMPVGMTRGALADHITSAGIACNTETYNHQVRSGWKIITDGSLGDYTRGAEVVSPILSGEAGFAAMRTVMNVLVAQGCKVQRTCGFHVHVGVRDQGPKFFHRITRLYSEFEAIIEASLSPSRRGRANAYCAPVVPVRGSTMDEISREAQRHGRYRKVNVQSFWRHGTVEFRQHQGTVDADKAEHWVRFCLAMVEWAASDRNGAQVQTRDGLFTTIDLDPSTVAYFNQRAAHFASRDRRAA